MISPTRKVLRDFWQERTRTLLVVLAIAIAWLVPKTFAMAIRGDYERHKRWARITFPLWLYVSVTGVLVYFFLYVWWPAVPVG